MESVIDEKEDQYCCIDFKLKLKEGRVFTNLELRILLDHAQKHGLKQFEKLLKQQS